MVITGKITIPYVFINHLNNNLKMLFREGKTSVKILVPHTWRSIKSGVTNKTKYWRIDQVKFVKYSTWKIYLVQFLNTLLEIFNCPYAKMKLRNQGKKCFSHKHRYRICVRKKIYNQHCYLVCQTNLFLIISFKLGDKNDNNDDDNDIILYKLSLTTEHFEFDLHLLSLLLLVTF